MDTRSLYHAVRRAGTSVNPHPSLARPQVRRATTYTDLRRAPAPRGMGPRRDEIARACADLRRAEDVAWAASRRTLRDRLHDRLRDIYAEVIESRGGETTIEGESRAIHLHVKDRADGLVLLAADGWRQYSRRFGARPASLRYLCGRDDNGRWAVRVPGTVDTVADALAFVEPAAVAEARRAGRQVLRQGDVYVIEQRTDNMNALAGTRHRWDEATRTLYHDDPDAPHGALHVPFRAKAILQSVLRMGRSNGRGRGD